MVATATADRCLLSAFSQFVCISENLRHSCRRVLHVVVCMSLDQAKSTPKFMRRGQKALGCGQAPSRKRQICYPTPQTGSQMCLPSCPSTHSLHALLQPAHDLLLHNGLGASYAPEPPCSSSRGFDRIVVLLTAPACQLLTAPLSSRARCSLRLRLRPGLRVRVLCQVLFQLL